MQHLFKSKLQILLCKPLFSFRKYPQPKFLKQQKNGHPEKNVGNWQTIKSHILSIICLPSKEILPLAGDSTSCIALSSCWFKSNPHLTFATGGFEDLLPSSLSRCSPNQVSNKVRHNTNLLPNHFFSPSKLQEVEAENDL